MRQPTKTQLLNAGIIAVFVAILLAVVYALVACTGQDPGLQTIVEQLSCECPVGSCECAEPTSTPPTVPAWVALEPTAHWTGGNGLGYVQDALGIVHVTGTATWSTGAGATVVVLPVRPRYQRMISGYYFSTAGSASIPASYDVDTNGAVTVYPKYSLAAGDVVFLDGVEFLAAP